MNQVAKIVHESSYQRQHVRLKLPIDIELGGQTFRVEDWSVAGFSVGGVTLPLGKGDLFMARLRFPFEGFDFAMQVRCEVRHIQAAGGGQGSYIGCRFVEISPRHQAMLHFFVDAYLSGEIADAGDLIAIAARENFGSERKLPPAVQYPAGLRGLAQRAARGAAFASLLVAGTVLVAVICLNLFERFFIVHGEGTLDSAQTVIAPAPRAGTAIMAGIEPGKRVAPGTLVARVMTSDTEGESVTSPCDCLVGQPLTGNGTSVGKGQPLITLVPVTAAVRANVDVVLDDLRSVSVGDRAYVSFYDGREAVYGRVADIRLPVASAQVVAATPPEARRGTVVIEFDTPIDAQLVGKPIEAHIGLVDLNPFS
ncbi:MAG TPA: PilZ domain-containing protein [Alphaproteobacteria bacterium]|nr:PilZ domain-containing protein [Alphaproteobacteria bacterium]